ncbi:methyltransferase domain-containing protein [Streptomyces sp. NPDC005925]|uniref:methyltransferase domain-containing protein n=1 Tax=Streptomyces sp. NPDC005925 TaxID=3157172 RepID=UPI003400CD59
MTDCPDGRASPADVPSFEELVTEGAAVPTEGWDFSWFEGRATEARPSWGYAGRLAAHLAVARAALDIQTGGGEVLEFALRTAAPARPGLAVATEGWAPNVVRATALLRPYGVPVVDCDADAPLPFADDTFDVVSSRHPVRPHWSEIARVLAPGGTYVAQHVGPASAFELVEHFLGPLPDGARAGRHPDAERADAEAAGLELVDLRAERLRMEFHDIAAVVHFLRKVVWMVPGFTVGAYEPQLRALHHTIRTEGPFTAHSARHFFELRKPSAGAKKQAPR